jgi:REP element-mobilizing transposase RayT
MARKWSNLNLPGALHYVTGNFLDRQPVFSNPACCTAFLERLAAMGKDWPAKIISYVLMPDHFHLIVNPRDGRIKEFMLDLKSLSAKQIVKTNTRFKFEQTEDDGFQVWQESFKGQALWSSWMIWQKINYIHANPVKAGLVKTARDHYWSSFRSFYSIGESPLAVDREWWWPEDGKKLSEAMKKLGWYSYHKRK